MKQSGNIHINSGLTQTSAELYSYAFNSFSTALSIIETFNETDHLLYGLIYRGMGQFYEESEQLWQAILYYWKTEKICKKTIPSNHELRQQINYDIKRISTIKYRAHEDL